MKTLVLLTALFSLPAFAASRVELETQTRPVVKLKQLRPGDEIGFPQGFELTRDARRPGVLTTKLELAGYSGSACEFNAWDHGFDRLELGGHIYWKVKELPEEVHEVFKYSRTRLVLVDPRSGREMSMTCDKRVDLDCLRDADFDIPWENERGARFERFRRSGPDEDRPERVERLDRSSSAL